MCNFVADFKSIFSRSTNASAITASLSPLNWRFDNGANGLYDVLFILKSE
jgi:hypothetical protein